MSKNKHLIGITSPPYEEAISSMNWEEQKKRIENLMKKGKASKELIRIYNQILNGNAYGELAHYKSQYSSNPENIGNLKHQPQELDFDITQYHKCGGEIYWQGCYGPETYYKQFVTPESYAHPAKISFLLTERIFKHLEHLGLLKEGMTVCDIMAGSGRIPLVASLKGYDSVGVELEPHFIKMCEDNKKFAENKVGRKLNFEIIQGDSRQLSRILNKESIGITSPPFESSTLGKSGTKNKIMNGEKIIRPFLDRTESKKIGEFLKNNRLNLNLSIKDIAKYFPSKTGGLTGCVWNWENGVNIPTSQQYQRLKEILQFDDKYDQKIMYIESIKKEWKIKGGINFFDADYGNNPSNIGNLPYKEMVGVVSPPYQDVDAVDYTKENAGPIGINSRIQENRRIKDIQIPTDSGYSQNPQNIGNLKDKELVGITSPPYENATASDDRIGDLSKFDVIGGIGHKSIPYMNDNSENLGNQQGQSYLSAMLQVYQEAYKSGMQVISVITKNPTRNGKLRRLDMDTALLLEKSNFKIVDYHRAILFKTFEQATLTGETKKEHKGRLSFFKRLSLAKGNKAAQFEDILIAVRV